MILLQIGLPLFFLFLWYNPIAVLEGSKSERRRTDSPCRQSAVMSRGEGSASSNAKE